MIRRFTELPANASAVFSASKVWPAMIFPRIRHAVVGQALRLPNQNTATDAVALQLQFNPRYPLPARRGG